MALRVFVFFHSLTFGNFQKFYLQIENCFFISFFIYFYLLFIYFLFIYLFYIFFGWQKKVRRGRQEILKEMRKSEETILNLKIKFWNLPKAKEWTQIFADPFFASSSPGFKFLKTCLNIFIFIFMTFIFLTFYLFSKFILFYFIFLTFYFIFLAYYYYFFFWPIIVKIIWMHLRNY